MIVRMKKISVVFLDRDKDSNLNALADAGAVHLEECRGASGESEAVQKEMQTLEKALTVINSLKPPRRWSPVAVDGKPGELAADILRLEEELKRTREQSDRLLRDKSRYDAFGDVSVDDLALIRDRGTSLRFYRLDPKTLKAIPDDKTWLNLGKSGGKVVTAFVESDEDKFPEEWVPLEFPEIGSSEREVRLKDVSQDIAVIESKLLNYISCRDILAGELKALRDLHLWESVKAGLSGEGELAHLTGYIPANKVEEIKRLSSENGWALLIDDPAEEDAVPTLLKTNAITGLLKPVLDMLGILPGYREYDVSFFFLLFFSIFTAMLIGDAGYGFLFLGVALIGILVSLARKKKVHVGLALLTVLSVILIVWGAATGTWFSSKFLGGLPFLEQFKLGYFSGTPEHTNDVIMFISFFLGVVQLCLACLQGFLREFPQLKSFARLGWLATLIVVYFFVLSQLLKMPFPPYLIYVLIGGVGTIFVFGSQEKGRNFFKGLLFGFTADLLPNILNVIGTFSNIMSYIRLFAVGMASVKIAEIFNGMAAPLAHGTAIIGAVLILLVGHGLNIALCLLSVMVHAIRLNILEYSGQLGMEWSGFTYDPFRVKKTENDSRGESI